MSLFFIVDTTASEGGVAPERPLESPNRITRLIANRREKLMRMAAMERSASDSGSEGDNAHPRRRSKSKSKSKSVKRKHTRLSGRRRLSSRRKCTVLKVNSDSDSDDERPVDAAQPSTSSGVIFRRSRYVASAIEKDDKSSSYSSSSSVYEDIVAISKRKRSKTDSDTSVKTHKRKHRKCKNSSRHDGSGKSQNKRQKLDDDSEEEEKTASPRNCVNGNSSKDHHEDGPSTPNSKSLQVPCTPDSGIKSGISSTGGKNSEQMRKERNDRGADDSSDEQKLKRLECFRKKVEELARRSYRNRSASQAQTVSTTSDSSD